MKVYIGPYKDWIGPYQIAEAIFFWTKKFNLDGRIEQRWDYKLRDKLGDWLNDTWVRDFCTWIDDKKKREIEVHIDDYDVWSADHTLAYIIHPILEKLQKVKHGSPNVDDEDVPEDLRSTAAPPKKNEWDTDENHHKRWDWILNEMIWSFAQVIDDRAEDQFHTGKHDIQFNEIDHNGETLFEMVRGPNDTHVFDKEGWEKWNERKQNGFRLFGKYYQALWD